jgi:uncharacterized membrane protein (DUF485 family)
LAPKIPQHCAPAARSVPGTPRIGQRWALGSSISGAIFFLPSRIEQSNNLSMKKKTMLQIAACLELLLGVYFMFAVVAWFAKLFLSSTFTSYYGAILIVLAALSAICFVLYSITMSKARNMDSK